MYLGWGAFNARRGAKNFSDEEFAAALAYCHERGVRVFLTLNTLVTDRELPQALETAGQAGRLGVDAVLVQDWGLFGLLRRTLPDLPLHASTQMSLFTSGGARELAADGCERVVHGPGVFGGGHPTICENCPWRGGGLCPRGVVHVLLRPVRDERPDRGPLRQPGPLRPALPPALRG